MSVVVHDESQIYDSMGPLKKHSSRMRTTRFSDSAADRDLLDRDPQTETPWTETPRQRPQTETPGQRLRDKDPLYRDHLDRDSPGQILLWTETPGQKPPRGNMGAGTETP